MQQCVIGILDCDELAPELKPDYLNYSRMFEELLSPEDASVSFRSYQVLSGELPERPTSCDAYLITGSKAGVYDPLDWLAPLREFLQTAFDERVRMVGICFGHQMLADSLGGKAEKSAKGWGLGVRQVTRIANGSDSMPEPLAHLDSLNLLYSHQDQVTRLPTDAHVLFGSDFCPYASWTIPSRVLTFQGHPEFTYDYMARLMALRQSRYASGQYEQALATLDTPVDNHEVAKGMMKFLTEGCEQ